MNEYILRLRKFGIKTDLYLKHIKHTDDDITYEYTNGFQKANAFTIEVIQKHIGTILEQSPDVEVCEIVLVKEKI